jgi:hypothetical protein
MLSAIQSIFVVGKRNTMQILQEILMENSQIRILAVIILECTIFESTCFIFRKTKIQLKFEKKHDKLNMKGLQSGDTCPLKVSVSGQEGKLWSIWKAISQFIVN